MNIRHKIPPISWKHSQSNAPVPLAAMCRTEPGFQNGDCVLTMSSWGIRVARPRYLLLRRPSIFKWVSFYREYAIYSIRGSLGTDIMPKWNKLTFLRVSWRQLCRLLTSSRHMGVRSRLVSYGDSNVWPGGLLQATVHQSYNVFIIQIVTTLTTRNVSMQTETIWCQLFTGTICIVYKLYCYHITLKTTRNFECITDFRYQFHESINTPFIEKRPDIQFY